MIKGLYRSASAMIPRIKKQETIANNLANVSSPGFKKDLVFTKELSRAERKQAPQKSDWQTPMIDQVYTNFNQGGFDKTGNPLDLAIEGEGFFVFETDAGEEVFSRAGNLTVNPSGFIVNLEGHRLMTEGGALNVGGGEVSVSENGQVSVDASVVGKIRVADVEDRTLLNKIGSTEFILPAGVQAIPAVNFAVRQGYMESSNVDIIKEMVDMIVSYRNFEADSKSVKTQDESLEKLLVNVGRTR